MSKQRSRARPLFSVIIPTYKRPDFLGEAVSSVLAQTVEDLECIVVDDGGGGSLELVADSRLRVIRRSTNGGPAVARNAGMVAARGTYICFLDDDDVYRPHRLEVALEALKIAPIGLCASRYMDAKSGRIRRLHGCVGDSILDDMTPHLGATALHRHALKNFDPRYSSCEDVEWWLRVSQDTEIKTIPEFAHLIRRHDTPRHMTGKKERIKGGLQLLHSHKNYFEAHPRAAAFRWKRIGLAARSIGDMKMARSAFISSFRLHAEIRTLWHLGKCLRLVTSS